MYFAWFETLKKMDKALELKKNRAGKKLFVAWNTCEIKEAASTFRMQKPLGPGS